MLTPEEKILARSVYDQLGEQTCCYYAECYVESQPIEVIARVYQTTETEVRNRLRQVEEFLTDELHDLLVRYLTERLAEIKRNAESFREQAKRLAESQAPAITNVQQILSYPTTPVILDAAAQVAAKTPFLVETAAVAGTAAVASGKSLWSLSSILAALAMPLLLLMSMMTTGNAMGLALVREAPTYYAKRWLVKQLFFCYSAILVVPIVLYFAIYLLCNVSKDAQHLMGGVIWTCLFGGILAYYPWVNNGYQKAVKTETLFVDESRKLEILVYIGSKILTFISICFFLWYFTVSTSSIFERFIFTEHRSEVYSTILKTISFGFLLFLYHSSGHYLFGELIMMTEGNKDPEQKPIRTLIKETVLNYWKKIKPELTYMAPFIIFTVGINVLHLTISRTRIVIACLEMAAVIPWWLLVLQHNMRDPSHRMRNIYITFLIMFVVLFTLRYFVYHPYDM